MNGFTINDSIKTEPPSATLRPLLDLEEGRRRQCPDPGGSGGNDGVGFAIPSDTVGSVVDQLLDDGSVEHAYLGVGSAEIPRSVAGELGVSAGVAITEVREGTPADEADLRAATGTQSVDGQGFRPAAT